MEFISKTDKEFIEVKYHLLDGSFKPYNRFACMGYRCAPETGRAPEEIKSMLEGLYADTRELPHSLVKAKGFEIVLDNARAEYNPHDYFPCAEIYTDSLWNSLAAKWYDELIASDAEGEQIRNDFEKSGTSSIWLDTSHFVPNWLYIMEYGIPGIIENARKYRRENEAKAPLNDEQKAFFDSIDIEFGAMLRFIKRLSVSARALEGERAVLVADSLERLCNGAPQNTLDALELMYLFFLFSEGIEGFQARSLGNGLDRTLYPFYKNDIESGTFTRDEIKVFLAYFMFQFTSIGHPNGHPFYIGGTEPDGTCRVSDLTYDILEVYEALDIFNPKIQVKINTNTPPEFIERVLSIIRSGKSSFLFCCQPGMVKALMGTYGATYEEALDADISGCNEMHIRGNEASLISALVNAAKAVVYTITNGFDRVTGKRLGLETGDFTSFTCFDEFYEAFTKQLRHIVDTSISVSLVQEALLDKVNPAVMISGTNERSMKKMLDGYSFGVKYTNSAILLCSFASAVNSVLAVKELVYDKKLATAAELREALNCNWEGYEPLRRMAKGCKHKYGRGDEVADQYAAAIFNSFCTYTSGRKNSRGGVYKVGVASTLDYMAQGKRTGATPDGRKMGEELSKNTQPVVGTETGGVTGFINSALKLQLWMFSEALVLDVMLHPSAVSGEEGLEAMRALIESYMERGGISIQFNIFSTEMLRDAQENPEKYKNLQVRVTGWNSLWNDMSQAEQEAYITRAESLE